MATEQLDAVKPCESTEDVQYRTRLGARSPVESQKVILNDVQHGPLVGRSTDESFGGIGVLFQKCPTLRAGQNLEYTHRGVLGSAIVRHITRGPRGYLLGLEWRGANMAQAARRATAERQRNPQIGFTVSKERENFIHTLPSSVHMIWSLGEARNWAELAQYTARLLERAKSLGIERLNEPVEELRRTFQITHETDDVMLRCVARVIKTCVAICGDGE